MLQTSPSFNFQDGSINSLDDEIKNTISNEDETLVRTVTIGATAKMLQTSPSFNFQDGSIHSLDDDIKNTISNEDETLVRTVTIGDSINTMGSFDFSLARLNMNLIIQEEEDEEGENGDNEEEEGQNGDLGFDDLVGPCSSPPMYMASGLGDGDGDGGLIVAGFMESGKGEEECYGRLVDEFPNHPLVLRNYALLLQSKGRLHEAESYYLRATQSDPSDGETLSQYAKLVWEVHHDQDKALAYFERAVQASPEDSSVLGAYARFMWEIDEDENDTSVNQDYMETGGAGGANTEENYRRIVEENPSSALALKNYAQFLYQSKGDTKGADEYYSLVLQADPQDGEALLQLAKLTWELYHDRRKASCFFKRAIQANTADSYVLGAYASFLWAVNDDDDSEEEADSAQMSISELAMPSASA